MTPGKTSLLDLGSARQFERQPRRTGSHWTVYLNFKTGTKEKFTAMTEKQLVKASRDLAEMLGAIQWK